MKRAMLALAAVAGVVSISQDARARPIASILDKPTRLAVARGLVVREYKISLPTIDALAMVESSGNPRAVSGAGAYGLLQVNKWHIGRSLCPEAQTVNDLFDPATSTLCGARILRYELNNHGDDLGLALGAYNGGPKCVRDGRIVCKESRVHSERVLMLLTRSLSHLRQ